MNMSDLPVVSTDPRGCGKRKQGGVYAECGLSSEGWPIEHFLVDPPQVVDEGQMGLSSIGVKLLEARGAWHVFDIVGQQHYPHVADFIEEARRMGASRRLSRTLDFSKLTADSKLVLLHRRAHIDNSGAYYEALFDPRTPEAQRASDWECPTGLSSHAWRPGEMCAGLWWADLEALHCRETPADGGAEGGAESGAENGLGGGNGRHQRWPRHPLLPPLHGSGAVVATDAAVADAAVADAAVADAAVADAGRVDGYRPLAQVNRRMASLAYAAWARPAGIDPEYRLAIFMALPITRLAVIRARSEGHAPALAKAQQAHLPVEVCDE
jgi:hypothetical protein